MCRCFTEDSVQLSEVTNLLLGYAQALLASCRISNKGRRRRRRKLKEKKEMRRERETERGEIGMTMR